MSQQNIDDLQTRTKIVTAVFCHGYKIWTGRLKCEAGKPYPEEIQKALRGWVDNHIETGVPLHIQEECESEFANVELKIEVKSVTPEGDIKAEVQLTLWPEVTAEQREEWNNRKPEDKFVAEYNQTPMPTSEQVNVAHAEMQRDAYERRYQPRAFRRALSSRADPDSDDAFDALHEGDYDDE